MHLIKHRGSGRGGRFFSVVCVDPVRVVTVAAWLDKLGHAEKRVNWRAVWLPDLKLWRIAYAEKSASRKPLEQFERDYYKARKEVQNREFPGCRWYSGIKKRVLRPE